MPLTWSMLFCKKCGGATDYRTVNAGMGVCRCPGPAKKEVDKIDDSTSDSEDMSRWLPRVE